MINFILPFRPVSVNAMWRKSRFGVIYLTEEGRKFKERVKEEIRAQLGEVDLMEGKVKIEITIKYMRYEQDLDNSLKVLLDAMQGIVYKNDRQIISIYALKEKDYEDAIIVSVFE